MIFDEIPFELKEYIFTYVTPNEWINTGKVSNEWLEITLGSIKKVASCHALILDHLAEFINQQRDTNYTCVFLLTLMPRLEHLECIENTEAFWTEISPLCHQLKILHCTPTEIVSFDWNKLDISFANLVELQWDGVFKAPASLWRIFQLALKLEKIALKRFQINAEWKNKIPKSVKHILLEDVQFLDERRCSMDNLCEDTSTLETFSACYILTDAVAPFFDAPRLKKLVLDHPNVSYIFENALSKCPNLETVSIDGPGIRLTDIWRKSVPTSVKSFKASGISVPYSGGDDFSFDWFFQNYGALQSLEVDCVGRKGVNPEKFYSPKNLKKLYLGNAMMFRRLNQYVDPFSVICYHMIGGSHLVDVQVRGMRIDEFRRHIFPPTIKKLKLVDFCLSNEAKEVFSPQFICENPSNIEFLSLVYHYSDLPGMNLDAFSGMNKLQELHLLDLSTSEQCLQSILTHCSALSDLVLHELKSGALTNIPRNLVLPSLRKLKVKKAVDQPSLLLPHFPKLRKVYITIVPPEECFADITNVLQVAEVVELIIGGLSWDLLHSLVENIDDTKFEYFCLSVVRRKEFSFYLTNSILDAFRKVYRFPLRVKSGVLWTKNYPTSPLLRKHVSTIPSNMVELSKRCHEIMAREDKWFYYEDSGVDDYDNNDGDGD